MPSWSATALFWSCAAAIVVAQVMILRSTARALRAGGGRTPALEWVFALAPALALALLLWSSWRAATRPPVIDVRLGPVAAAPASGSEAARRTGAGSADAPSPGMPS